MSVRHVLEGSDVAPKRARREIRCFRGAFPPNIWALSRRTLEPDGDIYTQTIRKNMKYLLAVVLVFSAATFAGCKSQDVAQMSDSQEYTLAVTGMT